MDKKIAGPDVRKEILQLSQNPENVRTTKTAIYDMMGLHLTKYDVCEAISDWINKGEEVQIIITKHANGHIGEPQYAMKPEINKIKCYIKVSIKKNTTSENNLLIISAHEPH